MIIRSKDIYAVPETIPETVAVRMKGEDHYGIARELLLSDLSTLFIGSPGMGKSTAIKKCIADLAKNKRGAIVIFDLKGEYLRHVLIRQLTLFSACMTFQISLRLIRCVGRCSRKPFWTHTQTKP